VAADKIKSGMTEPTRIFNKPATHLKDALPEDMTGEATNFGENALKGADYGIGNIDRELGLDGKL